MSFLDTWNNAYEGLPADNENTELGAVRIRDFKTNTRERANIDHSWGDSLDNGQHNQSSYNTLSADPTPSVAGSGVVYTKTIRGNVELFYKDSTGNIVQLTTVGTVDAPAPFPNGTSMVFAQASPPANWTQLGEFGDSMLRLVNDNSGGRVGGSWSISGTSISTGVGSLSASSSGSGSVSGTVAAHTLSVGELPAHTHNFAPGTSQAQINLQTGGSAPAAQYGNGAFTTDNGTGGGGSHTHGWSGSISVSVSTSISGAPTASFSNDATWRPAYINVLIATFNG